MSNVYWRYFCDVCGHELRVRHGPEPKPLRCSYVECGGKMVGGYRVELTTGSVLDGPGEGTPLGETVLDRQEERHTDHRCQNPECEALRTKLDRVAGLPEKWRGDRAHTYASENADEYRAADGARARCADELEQEVKGGR